MKADELNRLRIKTCEEQLVQELMQAYRMAPRVAEAILEEAQHYLTSDSAGKHPGQMQVVLSRNKKGGGKSLRDSAMTTVMWTIDAGAEDSQVLAEHGAHALRQVRVQRLLDEAVEQGAVASQEDVSRALQVSVRTIKRDCAELEARGEWLPTRGRIWGIGRGQTHKAQIVGRWLRGETYDVIAQRTHHSGSSIQRYVQTFVRVMQAREQGLSEAQIGQVVQIGVGLVKEYVAVYEQHDSPACRERLAEQRCRMERTENQGKKGAL